MQLNNPISWYKYETAQVKILWKGKVQPMGFFTSAEEALKVISQHCQTESQLKEYSIYTPNGILNRSNF